MRTFTTAAATSTTTTRTMIATARRISVSVVQNAGVDELQRFLRPLFLDLDGVSRLDDAERIARIAVQLHPQRTRSLELLLAFHLLGRWLDRVGNASRTALNTGISEADLRKTA